MKKTAILGMLMALAAVAIPAQGAGAPEAASTPTLGAPSPTPLLRGGQVSITGDNLPTAQRVVLCDSTEPDCKNPHSLSPTESTSKSLKFVVPPNLKPGTYRVGLLSTGQEKPALFTSTPLEVTRAVPTISALSESVLYPTDLFSSKYGTLTIQGTGFASQSDGNHLARDANGIKHDDHGKTSIETGPYPEINQLLINDVPLENCADKKTLNCIESRNVEGTDTTIVVSGIPREVGGPVKIAVEVENAVSKPHDLLLSRYPRYAPRVSAAVVVILVLGFAYLGGRRKVAVPQGTPTARIARWKTLFIDMDSATYSLSRLQLVIWTFVALFGWVYLSVARSFIQGMVTFSDIPPGLPGVLIVSVGTSVAATGVQSVKGTKSSGPFSPSFSDFFSVGGIVAPERAQFFLWTIVGAFGFLAFTLALDPATIQNLPTLPDGFLQLAGISAFGYVGGKLVRKAGPVLKGVKGTAEDSTTPATITWTLTGTGLAKNATFAYKKGDGTADSPETSLGNVDVAAKDTDQDGDPTLFKVLKVKTTDTPDVALPTSSPPAAGQTHPVRLFVIINPDGQRAEWPY